ncbi:hypothetical protein PMAN_a2230 [Pseudoalteromonas marina]|uniref:hypothetical protein n=1 Tax=Pseudoalteromonas marina TaxID=267375 RepID=UPI00026D0F24|nr:hypothetical protein [Pseudoalteromonas marina]KAF7777024.1 hypothetical protein PMAN_a2230 [Pseudoalteromonas marina]
MKKNIDSDRFYVNKRAKSPKPLKNKSSSDSQYEEIRKEVLKYFNKMIPQLAIKNFKKQQTVNLEIDHDFSMFVDAEKVLSIIGSLTQYGLLKKVSEINIDQSSITEHDLTSEVLIAQAALSLKAYKSKNNKKIAVNGTFPNNVDFAKLIKGIGIVKQISSIKYFSDSTEDNAIFSAKGKIFQDSGLLDGDKKASVIEAFIEHMNESLSMVHKKLTDKAETDLIEIISEIIGNAEDHSNFSDSHWQFYGYTDKNSKGEIFQQLSIFNFGESISESLCKSMDKPIVYNRVNPYIQKHKGKVPENILYTISALQENISSKLDEEPDRGQGFTDLLLFFENVAKECLGDENNHVKMSILSGNVSIYFDGKYVPKLDDVSGRHLIYFNSSNQESIVPDNNYVKIMRETYFPGTIITLKYRLREEDYELDEV